ncbi:MAG: divalent-cation tolerance protein CutA [Balneolaceae bacterium]|nr:MAG: divalent-cation tolerance protein CutA [Balneolaceae bacterium]
MFRNLRFVYVTTTSKEEARKIGRVIVEEKLAACANIIDGMESIYQWKGEIETASECVLIFKTTYSNVSRLSERVKALHSYEVPCIISINLAEQEGNEDYLEWIIQSARRPISADSDFSPDDR